MTVAQAKKYLGIATATTTYDVDLAIYLPIVEATARQITGSIYFLQVNGELTTSSAKVIVNSVYSQTRQLYGDPTCIVKGYTECSSAGYPYGDPGAKMRKLHEVLLPGMQITGTGIADGSFITRVETFQDEQAIYLSAVATATGDVEAYTDLPMGYLPAIAKGAWWLISQQRTAIGDTSWTSRSVGPVSETRSASEMKIDGQYGMPVWFVKTFPRVYR